MASQRQLKSKREAVGNIRQMTKAMEMVAAAKMRKAEEVALASRPYARKSLELLLHLRRHGWVDELACPFFGGTSSEKACLVVVASDKGLAGSYNASVLKKAMRWREEQGGDVVAVGRKSRDFFSYRGVPPVAEFVRFSDVVTLYEASPVIDWVLSAYEEGRYGTIAFCSATFISALRQEVDIRQLLPLQEERLKEIVEGIVPKTGKYATLLREEGGQEGLEHLEYLLEPTGRDIGEALVRSLVRVAVFHLILEANASEHSSRMVAMKSATDNAEEIQERLTIELNKARQAAITQELSEISTAKEALNTES
ncbi:MAG: ATP synthase F1 subunit gamma [Patescibacteria group bacterium]